MDIVESELRFLEVDQDELEANYLELIDLLKSETSDEHHLNSAVSSLIDQLKKVSSDMPGFDRNDSALLQTEVIPSIQKQLDEISARDADARQNRQVIERAWHKDQVSIKL